MESKAFQEALQKTTEFNSLLDSMVSIQKIAKQLQPSAELIQVITQTQKAAKSIGSAFRFIQGNELKNFNKVLNNMRQIQFPKEYLLAANELSKIANTIQTPWVNTENALLSMKGIAELSSIGKALTISQPFEPKLVQTLRVALGDWRQNIALTDLPKMLDTQTRISIYEQRGFKKELTAFPIDAFNEALRVTGIKPTFIEQDYITLPLSSDRTPRKNQAAYNLLYTFEVKVRNFIIGQMDQHFGDYWVRQQIHPEILGSWEEKIKKAKDNGESPQHLIEYADFTDYERIITRRDNWNLVFKKVFRNKESLQESFHRLYPVRLSTMHSREITEDDYLILYVEIRRLLKAIGLFEYNFQE